MLLILTAKGKAAAYPLGLSECVACLLLAADGLGQTDDGGEDRRRRRRCEEEERGRERFVTPGQRRGENEYETSKGGGE